MKRPDFIFAGATRSGITGLIRILSRHPQIEIPTSATERFFAQDHIKKQPLKSCKIDFDNAVNGMIGNKISENRILLGDQEFDPARAHDGNANAKIIFTLRNPVERAYIQYLYAKLERKDRAKSFNHALEAELSGNRTPDTTGMCWIYKNQYQTHLEHWLSFFPKRNVFVMIFEEWTNPNSGTLRELESFLGLQNGSLHLKHAIATSDISRLKDTLEPYPRKYVPLNPQTRMQLEDILTVDKAYISRFIGREISAWN